MTRLKWRTRFNDGPAEEALAADIDPDERVAFARRRLDAINEQLKTEDGDVLELEREKEELGRELGIGDPARDSGAHINALAKLNVANRDHWDSKSKPRDEAWAVWDRAVAAGQEVMDQAAVEDGSLSMPQRLAALNRLQRAAFERNRRDK